MAFEKEWNFILRDRLDVGRNNHLTLNGVDLVELSDEYGTPLFVFDEATLVENFWRLRRAFEDVYSNILVCYSIKTNNNLAICQILRENGAFAEVCSELDLHVALKAGYEGERIIFDGPFKPKEALQRALNENVLLINIESFEEMDRLNRIAGEMGVKQAIGIRINPFKDLGFSKYLNFEKIIKAAYCHLESRFGFSIEEAYKAFERAKELKNLSVEGIMTHPYNSAYKLVPIINEIRNRYGIQLKYIDVGGGFASNEQHFVGSSDLILDLFRRKIGLKSNLTKDTRVLDIESIAKSVINEIRQDLRDSSEHTIIVEPGRFITSSAGILLVSVDHVKYAGGHNWVLVDGGTNLLPPFGFMELRKINVANKASKRPEKEVNVVGPLLYEGDFIALKVNLPRISETDILSIFNCGSYTLSRANQFLHTRPTAILVNSGGVSKVIREKETFDDFLYKDKTI
ncbi:MAG: diaminopimelate decarboxylase family protein [Candidatus Hodarchaeales archaeon]